MPSRTSLPKKYHPRRQPGRCAICGSTRHYTSQCTRLVKPKAKNAEYEEDSTWQAEAEWQDQTWETEEYEASRGKKGKGKRSKSNEKSQGEASTKPPNNFVILIVYELSARESAIPAQSARRRPMDARLCPMEEAVIA